MTVDKSDAQKLKVMVEVQKRSVEHVVDVPVPQERVVVLILKGVVEVAQCFPQASCQVKEILAQRRSLRKSGTFLTTAFPSASCSLCNPDAMI